MPREKAFSVQMTYLRISRAQVSLPTHGRFSVGSNLVKSLEAFMQLKSCPDAVVLWDTSKEIWRG